MRKPRVRAINIYLIIFNLILFTLLLWFIVHNSFFNVNTIYIQGGQELINDAAVFKTNENILFFPKSKYQNNITSKYPLIKSLQITKIYPSSLLVNIKERNPLIQANYNNQIVLIDSDGQITTAIPKNSETIKMQFNCQIELQNGKTKITDNNLLKLIKILYDIYEIFQKMPQNIQCNNNEYQMMLENIVILYNTDIDPTNLISTLQVLFKQFRIEGRQPIKVDLRFSKPVIEY